VWLYNCTEELHLYYASLKEQTESKLERDILDDLEFDLIGQYTLDEDEGLERFNRDCVRPVIHDVWLANHNDLVILNALKESDNANDVYPIVYSRA